MGRTLLTLGVVLPVGALSVVYQLFSFPNETPVVHAPATWTLVTMPPVPPSAEVRPGRPSMRGLSAHRVLVVKIQTYRMDEAMDITIELIDPLQNGYSEVLVYFHHPHTALAQKRVQWTPASGFIEIDFSDFQPVQRNDKADDTRSRLPLSKEP